MSQYMLLFSLGPVQSFIAQARKTRDLWLGSYLLSLLMEAAMDGIDENAFIFPAKQRIEGTTPDLPNKYIAVFDSDTQAENIALQSKGKIEALWKRLCEEVWQDIVSKQAKAGEENPRRIWDRQTNPNTFFEIFWVIEPKNGEEYAVWLKRTQETFAARKRLRHVTLQDSEIFFTDKNSGKEINLLDEPGEKSTISGEREALHGAEAPRLFWEELAKKLIAEGIRHGLSLGGEERLDAIDTVKRFAYHTRVLKQRNIDAGFPSTSSIATATFVESLLRKKPDNTVLNAWLDATIEPLNEMPIKTIPYLKKVVDEEQVNLDILRRDGDCYFPETFTARRLEKDYGITPISVAEHRAAEGLRALRNLLQATNKLEISRPTPYYAMIQMDGDNMGKLLDGVQNKDEHTAISKALSVFSREDAKRIVETTYPGRLIYAGGDDVFALAPLARDTVHSRSEAITVLNLVDELRKQYHQRVAPRVSTEERRIKVTASTGIAIAHHYTALSYVRRVSKEAETLAKKHYGRNALVMTVIRRSGEQTRVGCRWYYEIEGKQSLEPIPTFLRFYELFRDDVLSPKCVYNLLEEADTLVSLNKEVQQGEIKRVLQRQYDRNKASKLRNENELTALAVDLAGLAAAMDADKKPSLEEIQKKSVELHSSNRRYGLVEVLGWLLLMVFLARKEQE